MASSNESFNPKPDEQLPPVAEQITESDQLTVDDDPTIELETDPVDSETDEQLPPVAEQITESDQLTVDDDPTIELETDPVEQEAAFPEQERTPEWMTADTAAQIAATIESIFDRAGEPVDKYGMTGAVVEVDPRALRFVKVLEGDVWEPDLPVTISVRKPPAQEAEAFRWEYEIVYGMRNQFLARHVLILNHEPKIKPRPKKRLKSWLGELLQLDNNKDDQVAPQRTGEISYYYGRVAGYGGGGGLNEEGALAIFEDLKIMASGSSATTEETTPKNGDAAGQVAENDQPLPEDDVVAEAESDPEASQPTEEVSV